MILHLSRRMLLAQKRDKMNTRNLNLKRFEEPVEVLRWDFGDSIGNSKSLEIYNGAYSMNQPAKRVVLILSPAESEGI